MRFFGGLECRRASSWLSLCLLRKTRRSLLGRLSSSYSRTRRSRAGPRGARVSAVSPLAKSERQHASAALLSLAAFRAEAPPRRKGDLPFGFKRCKASRRERKPCFSRRSEGFCQRRASFAASSERPDGARGASAMSSSSSPSSERLACAFLARRETLSAAAAASRSLPASEGALLALRKEGSGLSRRRGWSGFRRPFSAAALERLCVFVLCLLATACLLAKPRDALASPSPRSEAQRQAFQRGGHVVSVSQPLDSFAFFPNTNDAAATRQEPQQQPHHHQQQRFQQSSPAAASASASGVETRDCFVSPLPLFAAAEFSSSPAAAEEEEVFGRMAFGEAACSEGAAFLAAGPRSPGGSGNPRQANKSTNLQSAAAPHRAVRAFKSAFSASSRREGLFSARRKDDWRDRDSSASSASSSSSERVNFSALDAAHLPAQQRLPLAGKVAASLSARKSSKRQQALSRKRVAAAEAAFASASSRSAEKGLGRAAAVCVCPLLKKPSSWHVNFNTRQRAPAAAAGLRRRGNRSRPKETKEASSPSSARRGELRRQLSEQQEEQTAPPLPNEGTSLGVGRETSTARVLRSFALRLAASGTAAAAAEGNSASHWRRLEELLVSDSSEGQGSPLGKEGEAAATTADLSSAAAENLFDVRSSQALRRGIAFEEDALSDAISETASSAASSVRLGAVSPRTQRALAAARLDAPRGVSAEGSGASLESVFSDFDVGGGDSEVSGDEGRVREAKFTSEDEAAFADVPRAAAGRIEDELRSLIVVATTGEVFSVATDGSFRWQRYLGQPLAAAFAPGIEKEATPDVREAQQEAETALLEAGTAEADDESSVSSSSLPFPWTASLLPRNSQLGRRRVCPSEAGAGAAGLRRLLPSYDGNVFLVEPDGTLVALHVSVPDVVSRLPFQAPLFPGVYFVGGKESAVKALRLSTGEDAGPPRMALQDAEATRDSLPSPPSTSWKQSGEAGEELHISESVYRLWAVDSLSHRRLWGFAWVEVGGFSSLPRLPPSPGATRALDRLRRSLRAEGDVLYIFQSDDAFGPANNDEALEKAREGGSSRQWWRRDGEEAFLGRTNAAAASPPIFLKFPAPIAAVYAVAPLPGEGGNFGDLGSSNTPPRQTLFLVAQQFKPAVRAASGIESLGGEVRFAVVAKSVVYVQRDLLPPDPLRVLRSEGCSSEGESALVASEGFAHCDRPLGEEEQSVALQTGLPPLTVSAALPALSDFAWGERHPPRFVEDGNNNEALSLLPGNGNAAISTNAETQQAIARRTRQTPSEAFAANGSLSASTCSPSSPSPEEGFSAEAVSLELPALLLEPPPRPFNPIVSPVLGALKTWVTRLLRATGTSETSVFASRPRASQVYGRAALQRQLQLAVAPQSSVLQSCLEGRTHAATAQGEGEAGSSQHGDAGFHGRNDGDSSAFLLTPAGSDLPGRGAAWLAAILAFASAAAVFALWVARRVCLPLTPRAWRRLFSSFHRWGLGSGEGEGAADSHSPSGRLESRQGRGASRNETENENADRASSCGGGSERSSSSETEESGAESSLDISNKRLAASDGRICSDDVSVHRRSAGRLKTREAAGAFRSASVGRVPSVPSLLHPEDSFSVLSSKTSSLFPGVSASPATRLFSSSGKNSNQNSSSRSRRVSASALPEAPPSSRWIEGEVHAEDVALQKPTPPLESSCGRGTPSLSWKGDVSTTAMAESFVAQSGGFSAADFKSRAEEAALVASSLGFPPFNRNASADGLHQQPSPIRRVGRSCMSLQEIFLSHMRHSRALDFSSPPLPQASEAALFAPASARERLEKEPRFANEAPAAPQASSRRSRSPPQNAERGEREEREEREEIEKNAAAAKPPLREPTGIPEGSALLKFLDNGKFARTFSILKLVGRGGFGAVYEVRHLLEPGNPIYAVKLILLHLSASEDVSLRRDFREVAANRDLYSKHVVRYYTWWCEEPRFLPVDQGSIHGLRGAPVDESLVAGTPSKLARERRRKRSLLKSLCSQSSGQWSDAESAAGEAEGGFGGFREGISFFSRTRMRLDSRGGSSCRSASSPALSTCGGSKNALLFAAAERRRRRRDLYSQLRLPVSLRSLTTAGGDSAELFDDLASLSATEEAGRELLKSSAGGERGFTRRRAVLQRAGNAAVDAAFLFKARSASGSVFFDRENNLRAESGDAGRRWPSPSGSAESERRIEAALARQDAVEGGRRRLFVKRKRRFRQRLSERLSLRSSGSLLEKKDASLRDNTTQQITPQKQPSSLPQAGDVSDDEWSAFPSDAEDGDGFVVFADSAEEEARAARQKIEEAARQKRLEKRRRRLQRRLAKSQRRRVSALRTNNSGLHLRTNKFRSRKRAAGSSRSDPLYPVVLLIQMEMCNGLTLRAWLDSPERDSADSSARTGGAWPLLELDLFKQLIKGIRDIHERGIVHRDLKPENIFVDPQTHVLKIVDFGLAKFIQRKTAESHQAQLSDTSVPASAALGDSAVFGATPSRRLPVYPAASSSGPTGALFDVSYKGEVIGTPAYAAPEGGGLCDEKADIYSSALILLELLCPRFHTVMERVKTLEAFKTLNQMPSHFPPSFACWCDLMREMARPAPQDRPSANSVLKRVKALLASCKEAGLTGAEAFASRRRSGLQNSPSNSAPSTPRSAFFKPPPTVAANPPWKAAGACQEDCTPEEPPPRPVSAPESKASRHAALDRRG